jgi:hypothetical protein
MEKKEENEEKGDGRKEKRRKRNITGMCTCHLPDDHGGGKETHPLPTLLQYRLL